MCSKACAQDFSIERTASAIISEKFIALKVNIQYFLLHCQARRNEKSSGGGKGATNYEILSATMVGRQRKFFTSNRLKRIEKLNICRRQAV